MKLQSIITILRLALAITQRRGVIAIILFCLTVMLIAPLLASDTPVGSLTGWHLVWSDEFEQPNGSPPDPAKWGYDTGGNGWGNNELQFYTSRTNNSRIENGRLVIEARQENYERRKFTSARLLTRGKGAWTYGRFEARIKIPHGQGVWPAFWMLGTNIGSVNWPACGEIDIMENIGKEPDTVHGTVHGPGYSGDNGIGAPAKLRTGATISDEFHVFAIECEPDRITWFLDSQPYFAVTPTTLPKNTRWAFNEPKFVVLNLAIGGAWPGNPDSTTMFPQRMIVDYVRVYQKISQRDAAIRVTPKKTQEN